MRGEPADADHRLQQEAHDQEGDEIADQVAGEPCRAVAVNSRHHSPCPSTWMRSDGAHRQQGEMARRIGRPSGRWRRAVRP